MTDFQVIRDCTIGKNTKIWQFVNLYECTIGDDCMIGSFVEIQKGATVGSKVKVSAHSFICEGVTIEDEVFIGHHAVFVNDKYPRATTAEGKLKGNKDWTLAPIRVKRGASIGSNATILGGVVIGEGALVGAGAVVTRDVPPHTVVVGNPARILRKLR